MSRLYRSEDDRIVAGVCGGLAEEYELDPALVRVLTVLLALFTGFGAIAYVVAALVMPTKSELE